MDEKFDQKHHQKTPNQCAYLLFFRRMRCHSEILDKKELIPINKKVHSITKVVAKAMPSIWEVADGKPGWGIPCGYFKLGGKNNHKGISQRRYIR
jgi:hypothetical protein